MEVLCEMVRRRMVMVMASLVLVLSFILEQDGLVLACTCLPKHPQQHYCDSDYAVRVKIFGQKLKLPNGQRFEIDDPAISDIPIEVLSQSRREWSGEIQKVFKGYDKLKHTTTTKIYSPFYDAMCGVGTLKNNEVYAIMGTFGHGGLNFEFCDWHHEWKAVTSKQRRGLRFWYAENCACQIETCGLRHPCGRNKAAIKEDASSSLLPSSSSPSSCEWNAWRGKCSNEHSACVRTAEGCQWYQSKDFRKCLNEP